MDIVFKNQLARRAACLVLILGSAGTGCASSPHQAPGPAKIKYDASSAWTKHYTPGHNTVADK